MDPTNFWPKWLVTRVFKIGLKGRLGPKSVPLGTCRTFTVSASKYWNDIPLTVRQ